MKTRIEPIKTATQVAAAGAGAHAVAKAPGLYLKRGKTGAGSWFFRYRWKGERLVMGLGRPMARPHHHVDGPASRVLWLHANFVFCVLMANITA